MKDAKHNLEVFLSFFCTLKLITHIKVSDTSNYSILLKRVVLDIDTWLLQEIFLSLFTEVTSRFMSTSVCKEFKEKTI